MGIGDDLLFLGEAEALHKITNKKIQPLYGRGWSPLFDNVEFLTKHKTEDSVTLNTRDTKSPSDYHVNYYEDKKESGKMIFRPYKLKKFYLRFTKEELKKADRIIEEQNLSRFMVINPDFKSSFYSNNKNWGFKKYQELTNRMSKHISVLRVFPGNSSGGHYNAPLLDNAINVISNDVRVSFAIMRKSVLGIGYDGFFIHALSGMNIPCVVIFGGLVSKKIMSYEQNISLEYDHPMTPCGMTKDCSHCKEANEYITVDMVEEACLKLL